MDLTPLCAGSMNLLLLHAQFSPGVKIDGRSKLYIYYALECAYGPLKMAARLCQPPFADNNLQSYLLHYITAASIWNSNCTLDRVSLWNAQWRQTPFEVALFSERVWLICKYVMIFWGTCEKFQIRLQKLFDHILRWLVNISQLCF